MVSFLLVAALLLHDVVPEVLGGGGDGHRLLPLLPWGLYLLLLLLLMKVLLFLYHCTLFWRHYLHLLILASQSLQQASILNTA